MRLGRKDVLGERALHELGKQLTTGQALEALKTKNSYSGLEIFPSPIFVLWVSPGREVHDKLNILSRLETATSFKKSGRIKFALENLNHDRDRD